MKLLKKTVFKRLSFLALLVVIKLSLTDAFAQNPIISGQFTADPSARVFGDKVYLYPSHDIRASDGKGRPGWFCMEDYHVFSSPDLTNWTDHGVIISQATVPWAKPDAYAMWAPDCIYRNGKYYFYFPCPPADSSKGRGFSIGVAISDRPDGPFLAQPEPIKGVQGIDPNVFVDKDGQAYLYWSQGHIYGAKLKDNMLELASEPVILQALPEKGLKEGSYLFERNGFYYMTFPHVAEKTERLEYAIGDKPLGPFKMRGVIMDESSTGCWTNHHSVLKYRGQWYLFYHHNDYSPKFDKNRSVRLDSLFFNSDGTIKKVIPTLRGVGLTVASEKIQIDRYSKVSDKGITVDFIDTAKKFEGWKARFITAKSWLQYCRVDFGKKSPSSVNMRVTSAISGIVQIRLNSIDGPVLAELKVPRSASWRIVKADLSSKCKGVQDLLVVLKAGADVDVDWLSFL